MFRSIQKTLRQRQGELSQRTENYKKIDSLLRSFLENIFGTVAKKILIESSLDKGTLTIVTTNKIAANELIFQSGQLCRYLQENQIACNRIVIR